MCTPSVHPTDLPYVMLRNVGKDHCSAECPFHDKIEKLRDVFNVVV
jgi:hypothetical protein